MFMGARLRACIGVGMYVWEIGGERVGDGVFAAVVWGSRDMLG